MIKEKLGEDQIKPQTNVLPPHVLNSIETSLKQYENGQTISFEEFKERHFSKK
ncbi:MAG TPA: hypothetical protein VIM16_11310 [Mucilaginibacter sp.]|jgi:hypothetical protein